MTQRIRTKAFVHLLQQEIAYFDRPENSSGAISNFLSSAAMAVQQMTGPRLGILCESLATFAIGLILGFVVSWQLAFVLFFYLIFLFLIGFIEVRWQMRLNERSNRNLRQASSVRL